MRVGKLVFVRFPWVIGRMVEGNRGKKLLVVWTLREFIPRFYLSIGILGNSGNLLRASVMLWSVEKVTRCYGQELPGSSFHCKAASSDLLQKPDY